jgi:predicted DNA-binding transcriptional regulator YafY
MSELRTHRCVWLTVCLLRRGFVSYSEFKARFNVTDRTYYRDLSALCSVGMAIESTRGSGRVRLIFRINESMLS